uniref:Uncharacterized protein LOC111131067 n=1 Tax=Crassostrea virginica TaxID=6565 RepID=A0A8B8E1J6_CRAVI|nr:uncharacterized protein LOC111131067 [Crassostrea virginica]XP_022334111.1 uncharacterized protein LOC111131067 [Crassostrea virginica]
MALVDLDDKETEAPLSRNKFRLLTYVKRFPEVVAQMESKQRGIEEERSRRKKVSMPAATSTKPAPPKKEEEMDEAKMDSILSSGYRLYSHNLAWCWAGRHVPWVAGQYRDARVDPPEVLYVDRDCCGPNYVGNKFEDWGAAQVRLDIWHYICRISSCCTTEFHPLYAQFKHQLSRGILK